MILPIFFENEEATSYLTLIGKIYYKFYSVFQGNLMEQSTICIKKTVSILKTKKYNPMGILYLKNNPLGGGITIG